MTVLSDVIVPLVAVLLGGAITYLVNVRERRRRRVEDILAQAIGAVATVIATSDFVQRIEWPGASPEDREAMNREVARDSIRAWVKAVGDARVAVAHASAYVPELAVRLRASPNAFTRDAEATVALLQTALTTAQKRRRESARA